MEAALSRLEEAVEAHLVDLERAEIERLKDGADDSVLSGDDDVLPPENRSQHLARLGDQLSRTAVQMTLLHNSVASGEASPSSVSPSMTSLATDMLNHAAHLAKLTLGARVSHDGACYTRAIHRASEAVLESTRDLALTLNGRTGAVNPANGARSYFLDATHSSRTSRALMTTGMTWDAANALKSLPANNGAAVQREIDSCIYMLQDALDELKDAIAVARESNASGESSEDAPDAHAIPDDDDDDAFRSTAGGADLPTLILARAVINVCQLLLRKTSVRVAPLAENSSEGIAWADSLAAIARDLSAASDDVAVAVDPLDVEELRVAATALLSNGNLLAEKALLFADEESRAWFAKCADKLQTDANALFLLIGEGGDADVKAAAAAPNR